MHDVTLEILGKDSQVSEMPEALHDYVTMSFMFGLDQINETYEYLESNRGVGHSPRFYQYLWPSELRSSPRDNR